MKISVLYIICGADILSLQFFLYTFNDVKTRANVKIYISIIYKNKKYLLNILNDIYVVKLNNIRSA